MFPVKRAWHRSAATGVGSMPGTSAEESTSIVANELSTLPHVVELPDRGVGADMVGRAVGMLVDIYGEVVPSGWRISRRPGRDTSRAKDFLAWDADAVQQHYAGAEWVKVQVCGPWTLAAMLEVPSGHRALTDAGAVDDLADSLAEGLSAHIAEIAARVPGAGIVVQIDEPALPTVLSGSLPTASGFGMVRGGPVGAGDRGAVPVDRLARRPTVDRPLLSSGGTAAAPAGVGIRCPFRRPDRARKYCGGP